MSVLALIDAARLDGPSLERHLAAVADLDARAARGARVDAAMVTLVELKQRIAAIGSAGGALDAVTWAAWTDAALGRALAVLAGEARTPAELERIGSLPPAPARPATAAAAPDPGQHALPV